jgi:predicted phosphoribosyltransferase
VAKTLALPLEIAVVSKITLPWNSEAGYGAVAFDGTVALNDGLLARIGLSDGEIQQGIAATRAKVNRRAERFARDHSPAEPDSNSAILVDDGIASGFSLSVAVKALSQRGVRALVVAVPTGHGESVRRLAGQVTALHCANVREGFSFAVADAFEAWTDVLEDDALAEFREACSAREKTSHG